MQRQQWGMILGLTLLICLGLYPGSVTAAMVSWWQAEDNAQDSKDGNHGTLQGGAGFAPGLVGKAFKLNGIDGFIKIPHADSLNFGTHDFTLCLWVKFAQTSGEQVFMEKYIETEAPSTGIPRQGWTLTKLPDNNLRLCGPIQTGVATIIDATPPQPIAPNSWYCVTVTRQGNLFTLYWNGSAIGSREISLDLNSSATTSLKIGHRGNPQDTPGSVDTRNFYLNGWVDEVAIWNHALGADELAYIYRLSSSTQGSGKTAVVIPY